MNEWGVPDWRDKTQYPIQPSELSHARWRWEFTRRLAPYRKDAMRLLETRDKALKQAYFETWGFWRPLDPRRQDYDDFDLLCVPPGGVVIPRLEKDRRKEAYSVEVAPNQFAILFDLDSPLPFQIERAREVLQSQQKQLHGKATQRRRVPKPWVGYLRAIDAEDAKATNSEMLQVFYADGILERHTKPEGGYGIPHISAISKLLRQARDLQSNFPD